MPVRRVKPNCLFCLLHRQAGIKLRAHRDAERRDRVRTDAVFHKFTGQRRIRDHAGIQPHAVARRACRVIRRNEHGLDGQRRLLLDKRQHQRREQMHAHDRVIAAREDRRAQPLAPAPQNAAGCRGLVKRRRMLLGVLIALVVKLGEIAVKAHVPAAHKAARAPGDI